MNDVTTVTDHQHWLCTHLHRYGTPITVQSSLAVSICKCLVVVVVVVEMNIIKVALLHCCCMITLQC